MTVRPETLLLSSCSAQGRTSGQPAGVWPPTVEQFAGTFVEQIRRRQRSGPYLLAGAGFGGVIAFEMARQLTGSGERVAVLALIDCLAPGCMQPASMQGWLRLGAQWLRKNIPMNMPDSRADARSRRQHMEQSREIALMNYRPAPWRGNVLLFTADRQPPAGLRVDRNLGWDSLVAGQLSAHTIAGDADGVLRQPAISTIADRLRPFLDTRASGHG